MQEKKNDQNKAISNVLGSTNPDIFKFKNVSERPKTQVSFKTFFPRNN